MRECILTEGNMKDDEAIWICILWSIWRSTWWIPAIGLTQAWQLSGSIDHAMQASEVSRTTDSCDLPGRCAGPENKCQDSNTKISKKIWKNCNKHEQSKEKESCPGPCLSRFLGRCLATLSIAVTAVNCSRSKTTKTVRMSDSRNQKWAQNVRRCVRPAKRWLQAVQAKMLRENHPNIPKSLNTLISFNTKMWSE